MKEIKISNGTYEHLKKTQSFYNRQVRERPDLQTTRTLGQAIDSLIGAFAFRHVNAQCPFCGSIGLVEGVK